MRKVDLKYFILNTMRKIGHDDDDRKTIWYRKDEDAESRI